MMLDEEPKDLWVCYPSYYYHSEKLNTFLAKVKTRSMKRNLKNFQPRNKRLLVHHDSILFHQVQRTSCWSFGLPCCIHVHVYTHVCTSVVHLEKFPRGVKWTKKKVLGGHSHKCENGSEVSRGGEIHGRGRMPPPPPLNEALYMFMYEQVPPPPLSNIGIHT